MDGSADVSALEWRFWIWFRCGTLSSEEGSSSNSAAQSVVSIVAKVLLHLLRYLHLSVLCTELIAFASSFRMVTALDQVIDAFSYSYGMQPRSPFHNDVQVEKGQTHSLIFAVCLFTFDHPVLTGARQGREEVASII